MTIKKVHEFKIGQKIGIDSSTYTVKKFPTRSMICLDCKSPSPREPSGMKIGIKDLRKYFFLGRARFENPLPIGEKSNDISNPMSNKPSIIQSPSIDELEAGEMVTRVSADVLLGGSIIIVDLRNLRSEFENLKSELRIRKKTFIAMQKQIIALENPSPEKKKVNYEMR